MKSFHISTSDGLKLAADSYGDSEHPPVILLHGGGQTRRSWQNGAQAIAAAGFHAVAYDARGHGDSDWSRPGDYSTASLVSDLKTVMDRYALPPILIGASLGGITAMHAVGNHPKAAAKALVMVDVAPSISPAGSARISAFMRSKPEGFGSLDEAIEAVTAYNPHRTRPPDPSNLLHNLRERGGRLFWHWDPAVMDSDRVDATTMRPANEAAARGVEIPTLLIRGSKSDLITQENVDHFLAILPHVEFKVVQGAGHMVAGDRNDAFNDLILSFLKKICDENFVSISNRHSNCADAGGASWISR